MRDVVLGLALGAAAVFVLRKLEGGTSAPTLQGIKPAAAVGAPLELRARLAVAANGTSAPSGTSIRPSYDVPIRKG